MSTVGPANLGIINLAGSLAGAQRSDASTDRVKSDAADQKHRVERKLRAASPTDDIADSGLSSDRDPDGRLSDDRQPSRRDSNENDGSDRTGSDAPPAKQDLDDRRGLSLDLQA